MDNEFIYRFYPATSFYLHLSKDKGLVLDEYHRFPLMRRVYASISPEDLRIIIGKIKEIIGET